MRLLNSDRSIRTFYVISSLAKAYFCFYGITAIRAAEPLFKNRRRAKKGKKRIIQLTIIL